MGAVSKNDISLSCRGTMSILFLGFQGQFLSLDLTSPFTGLDNFKHFLYWLIALFIHSWNDVPPVRHQWGGEGQRTVSASKQGSDYRALADHTPSLCWSILSPGWALTPTGLPDCSEFEKQASPVSFQKPLQLTSVHSRQVWWACVCLNILTPFNPHKVSHTAPNVRPTSWDKKVFIVHASWPTMSHSTGKLGVWSHCSG